MSSDPLGCRVDGYMCSPFAWTEEVSSHAEGVVYHHADALALCKLCDRLIIRNIECRIAEVLKVDGLGAAVDERLDVLYLVALGEAHLDAHIAESDGEHCECASVEVRLCHDVVTRAADVGDRKEYCRLS